MKDYTSLEKHLGYHFKDHNHLVRALTHKGYTTVSHPKDHYERLEFLGDRVLGLVVADMLLKKFPAEKEGKIAKRHSALVSRDVLLPIADRLHLGEHLIANATAYETSDKPNDGILADLVEAIIGAIYRDGSFADARDFVIRNWSDILAQDWKPFDPKTRLQEWAQARGLPVPSYEIIEQRGPDHQPEFVVEGFVETLGKAQGISASKKQAEKNAAETLLTRRNDA